MLKQRGHWHASGPQPEELGLEFNSLFTHEIEDMSDTLVKKSSMDSSKARQFLSATFQNVYQTCKESVLNQMHAALSRVLVIPEEQEEDEELYDICRAYGLLVNATSMSTSEGYKTCSREVCNRLNIFNNSTRGQQFEDVTDEMAHLSWKMLCIVPPMVSADISDAPFHEEWHDKEIEPDWTENLLEPDYNLVYYRPILFFSYEGKVCQKGWVGNIALEDGEMNGHIAAEVSSGKGNANFKGASAQSTVNSGGGRTKRVYKSYKKPSLKSTEIDSVLMPDLTCSIPDFGLESVQAMDVPDGEFESVDQKKEIDSTALFGLKKFY